MHAFLRQNRFALLLVMMLAMLAFMPFTRAFPRAAIVLELLTVVVLLAGVNAVSDHPRSFRLGLGLALLVAGLRLGDALGLLAAPAPISDGVVVLFFGVMAVAILRHVLQTPRTEANTVFAAVCVYLMMGFLWSVVFGLLETLDPGSFLVHGAAPGASPRSTADLDFVYYSFVTLTTLGYGDVLPQTGLARALAALEALLGQIYVAVLIAWLVGRYLSQSLMARRA